MRLLLASVALSAMFNSETCETIMVSTENGPVRINKSDYDADPGAYTVDAENDAPAPVIATTATPSTVAPGVMVAPAPAAPAFGDPAPQLPPSPNQKFVKQEGKKFYVTDANGVKVEGVAGIDTAGYKTDKEAWDAILALPH